MSFHFENENLDFSKGVSQEKQSTLKYILHGPQNIEISSI